MLSQKIKYLLKKENACFIQEMKVKVGQINYKPCHCTMKKAHVQDLICNQYV